MRWKAAALVLGALLVLGTTYSRYHSLDAHMLLASNQDYGFGAVNKFGASSDANATEQSVWGAVDAGGPVRCPADTAAFSMWASTTAASTATFRVEGLDSNWDAVTEDVTLAGITFVPMTTSWMRINRAYNISSTSVATVVYFHIDPVDGGAPDGIPDTPLTDIKAVVGANDNQTLQACYTVPDNYEAYVTSWCASALAGGTGDVVFRLRHYPNLGSMSSVQSQWSIGTGDRQCQTFSPPAKHGARHMFEITSDDAPAGAGDAVSGTFDLLLVRTN